MLNSHGIYKYNKQLFSRLKRKWHFFVLKTILIFDFNKNPETKPLNSGIQNEDIDEEEEKHDEGQHDQGRRSRCCLQRGASDVGRVHPYLGRVVQRRED